MSDSDYSYSYEYSGSSASSKESPQPEQQKQPVVEEKAADPVRANEPPAAKSESEAASTGEPSSSSDDEPQPDAEKPAETGETSKSVVPAPASAKETKALAKVSKDDRYGWKVEGKPVPESVKKQMKKDTDKETERSYKWRDMLSDFYGFKKKHRKTYERRVMKGIPDMWRAKAWCYILRRKAEDEAKTGKRKLKNPTVYFEMGVPNQDEVIRVDVPRTMPKVSFFERSDTRERLYNILRAYANFDSKTGYFQGMAFPAGILINYIADDYEAFWAFASLMQLDKVGLARLYRGSNFAGLEKLNQVWELIVDKKWPKVSKNLKANNVFPLMYTPSYFLTAFLSFEFPAAFLLRLFDRFVAFGIRTLISLAMALFDVNRKKLETGQLEHLMPVLQHTDVSNWPKILAAWDKHWLTERQYKKWLSRAKVDLGSLRKEE